MTEESEGKGFKIRDRRHFTADGDVRPESENEKPRAPEPSPPPPPRPRPQPQSQPRPQPQPQPGPESKPAAAFQQKQRPAPTPEDLEYAKVAGKRRTMDFMSFVASLATNALAALGALPPEQTGEMPFNPDLGREYIDIIGMLQEKTAGNLSAQEAQALQRIVSDLRMAYVDIAKGNK